MYQVIKKVCLISFLTLLSAPSYAENIYDTYEKALESFQDKNYNETIIHLKNAIQSQSTHLPSRVLLIETFLAQGKGELAQVELEQARSFGADIALLTALYAKAYMIQGKYQQVIELKPLGQLDRAAKSELLSIQGSAYLALNRFKLAKQLFEAALKIMPSNFVARLGIAREYSRTGQYSLAMSEVSYVLSGYKPPIEAWILKSHILKLQGNFNQAITAIDQAILVDENHLGARMARATLLLVQNNDQQAEQDVDFILASEEFQPAAKYLKAIIAAKTGRFDTIESHLKDIITTIGAVTESDLLGHPEYYFLAGKANFDLGYYNEARKYITKYLKFIAEDKQALMYLAEIELLTGFPASAKNILTKLKLNDNGNVRLFSLLGKVNIALGNTSLAEVYFQQVLSMAPNQKRHQIDLIRTYMHQGEYHKAIADINQILKISPVNFTAKLLLIDALSKLGRFEQAKVYSLELVQQNPENSRLLELLGRIEKALNNHQSALQYFNKAMTLDADNIFALVLYVRTAISAEQPIPPLVDKLLQKLTTHPESLLLMLSLGDLEFDQGNSKASLPWYLKAYDIDKTSYKTIKKLVKNYRVDQEPSKATILLESYTAANTDNAEAYKLLAGLYLNNLEKKKAIDALSMAAKKAKNRSFAYMDLAQAQIKLAQYEQAELSVLKAIGFDAQLIPAKILLTKLYIGKGDKIKALQVIAQVDKQIPQAATGLLLTGQLYLALQEYPQAEDYFEQALKITDSKQAILGLYSVAKKKHDYKEIIPRLGRWLDQYPDDFMVNVSLAMSYEGNKQLTRAAEVYKAMLIKQPEHPVLLNNLALVELELGHLSQAMALAEKAFKTNEVDVNYIDTFAWIKSQSGEYRDALDLFRKAIILDYSKPEIKYHLALTLDKLMRREEAHQYLAEAVQSEREFSEKLKAKELLAAWKKEQITITNEGNKL